MVEIDYIQQCKYRLILSKVGLGHSELEENKKNFINYIYRDQIRLVVFEESFNGIE